MEVIKTPPKIVQSGDMTLGQYRSVHNWIERRLGKPMVCSQCGDNSRKRYAWSNNSGKYMKDISDWERLCYSCHAIKDGIGNHLKKEYCAHGHKLTDENRYKTKRGDRLCKQCKKVFSSKAYLEYGLEAFNMAKEM